MHRLYDMLLSACDSYQAMQQAHLHCLATDAQPDIERLVFEREQFFADLQNHLTAVAYQLQTAVPESSLVHVLQARLAALLEDDAILAEASTRLPYDSRTTPSPAPARPKGP